MSRRARCFNFEKFVTHATSENSHILDKFMALVLKVSGTVDPNGPGGWKNPRPG